MKKLIALLAVLSFVPYAHAADGADVSHNGEFRLQYQNDMNADFNEKAPDSPDQTWHQRLRWSTNVRAGEKMSAKFSLMHNADWGMNTDQTPDTADGGTNTRTENLLIVHEAYMSWMLSDAWTLMAGRGSLTMGDGRFISANDYMNVPKAFDGILAVWDTEMAKLSFSMTRAADFDKLGQGFNQAAHFFGVFADFKSLPDFLKSANVHVHQVKRDDVQALGLAKQTNMKIGASVTGEVAGLDWRINYEMEDGENEDKGATPAKTDISTSMMDLEVGYSLPDMMNSRFHVGYHTDSGTSSGNDDETYDGFHYDVKNNAGLMDIFGWGNLTYMRAGAKFSPADDVTVGLEYFIFTQTEKKDGYYRAYAAETAKTAGDTTKDELGTELDVWVAKKYTNNFSIMARYGMFQPGDEFKAANTDDDYTQLYVEAKLTF